MTKFKYLIFVSTTLLSASLLRADTGLSTLGKAHLDYYGEAQKLGTAPTSDQLKSAKEKSYSGARKKLAQELKGLAEKFNDTVKRISDQFKSKSPALFGDKQAARKTESPSEPRVSQRKSSARRQSSPLTGAPRPGGAESVDFSARPSNDTNDKKPTVVDGIIQDR